MKTLDHIVTCFCGEVITATASEVLTFEIAECPNCLSEVYFTEDMYEEAKQLEEEYEAND